MFSLFNLSILESAKDIIINLFNEPVKNIVSLIKNLLISEVNINLFKDLWIFVVNALSLFYGIMILYVGLNLIIKSYDPMKRAKAKLMLRNSILIILLVNSSFILYDALLKLSHASIQVTYDFVNSDIYNIETNLNNLNQNIVFFILFLFTATLTLLTLGIRYLFVSIGLVLFPIGIVLYFFDSTKSYGLFVIESLLILIFLPLIHLLIIAGTSKLLEIQIFSNYSILLLIISYFLISIATIFALFMALFKSVLKN